MKADPAPPTPSDETGATLFLPRDGTAEGTESRAGWTLSPDLRQQITRRLCLIALTYSAAFFLADVVPSSLYGQVERFEDPWRWVPTVVSIVAGVVLAIVVSNPKRSWQSKIHLGLAFEVLGSYGIAIAQYFFPPDLRTQPLVLHVLSPSWVAVWMLFFSTVVPAPPRVTLAALIGSVTVICVRLRRLELGLAACAAIPRSPNLLEMPHHHLIQHRVAHLPVPCIYASAHSSDGA